MSMFMENQNREMLSKPQIAADDTDTNGPEEVNLLNELIATNLGMTKLYETAADQLEHEENAKLLREYAAQHQTFVKELSNKVVSLGGTPVTSADGSSLIKRAWVALKATLTMEDSDILVEIAQNAENVLEEYGEAMPQNISKGTRELIRDHISEIRLAYKKIVALGAAYNDS